MKLTHLNIFSELKSTVYSMKQAKIIATIGPASMNLDTITKLVREGVDAFRFNFSHGTYEEKDKAIENVRFVEEKFDIEIPLIADLTGPTIRLGEIEETYLRKGDVVYIINSYKGDSKSKHIPLPDKRTYNQIEEGDEILLDDGKITLLVDEVLADKIKCLVLNDGIIKSRRTFAIKGKEVSGPALTQKDINDVKYAVSKGFDYVALSFVRSIGDIERLRKLLRELGEEDMKIIAKIETRSAVEKIDEIISEADAVLVARGDLGMYFKLVEIPKIQELIIKKALAYGKPSIVATQLLESMVNNPIPTRSEVVDIMKAVEQGADALMLSNETAIGKYPVESVRWLRKIIEASPPCERVIEGVNETIYDKFAKGIVLLAESLGAKIVAFTRSGATARRLSRYRPRVPVYTVTNDKRVSRQLKILRGISSCYLEDASPENFWEKASKILEDKGELSSGDIVIVIRGMRKEATDLVRIEKL